MLGEVLEGELIGRWGDTKALVKFAKGTVREVPYAAYYDTDEGRAPEVGDYLCLYLNDEGEIARWEFCDRPPESSGFVT